MNSAKKTMDYTEILLKKTIEEMQKRIDLMLDFLPEEVELIAQMEKTERMVLDKYENR